MISHIISRYIYFLDIDSTFWVGVSMQEGKTKWEDGVPLENQPWVQTDSSIPGLCYIFNGAVVKNVFCDSTHRYICSRRKTLYNPTENCLVGFTEHSAIGEHSGNCIFRAPVAMIRDNADAKCAETGGHFMSWMLLNDNASAHRSIIITDFLAKTKTTVLPHPHYSPDLVPGDFSPIPKLAHQL
ncbi:uncharacterized protein TNCV_273031 [Trichonephila clavipes]|nr:uncharacterized protein TNCV_273031 [Trichonephila clavipes]